jgi:Prokaryotic E2 family D
MESSFNHPSIPPIIDGNAIAELTSTAPRNLDNIQAELLFVDETYLLHYSEGSKHIYKAISSQSIQRAFSNKDPLDSGWLNSNIIRHGEINSNYWVIMFVKRSRTSIQFERRELYIPLPALVFMGIDRDYYLWAIKETKFNPESIAYHAPLPNIGIRERGKICWGNIPPPKASNETIQQAWSLFTASNFNSDYTSGKSRQFPDNVIGQLERLQIKVQTSKHCRYPVSDLIAIDNNITIEALTQAILAAYRRPER